MSTTRDEVGVRLSEAVKVYCHPGIYEAYRLAGERIGWNTSHVRGRIAGLGGLTPQEKAKSVAVREFWAEENLVKRDIYTKLCDGRLIATGFFSGPNGRHFDAKRQQIPHDVILARNFNVRWQGEKFMGNDLTFVAVRLHAPCESPEMTNSLIGLSLAECFQRVVIDDWVREELQALVDERYWFPQGPGLQPTPLRHPRRMAGHPAANRRRVDCRRRERREGSAMRDRGSQSFTALLPDRSGRFAFLPAKNSRGGGEFSPSLRPATAAPTIFIRPRNPRGGYGLEIEPGYVDVIVRRRQAFAGAQATLDGDGRSFDEIAAARETETAS